MNFQIDRNTLLRALERTRNAVMTYRESYTNELKVKGMLFGAVGYYYLRPAWAVMTPTEQMEEISKMYPRNYD